MVGKAFEIPAIDYDWIERSGFEVAGPEAWPMPVRLNPWMNLRPPLVWETEPERGRDNAIVFPLSAGRAAARPTRSRSRRAIAGQPAPASRRPTTARPRPPLRQNRIERGAASPFGSCRRTASQSIASRRQVTS